MNIKIVNAIKSDPLIKAARCENDIKNINGLLNHLFRDMNRYSIKIKSKSIRFLNTNSIYIKDHLLSDNPQFISYDREDIRNYTENTVLMFSKWFSFAGMYEKFGLFSIEPYRAKYREYELKNVYSALEERNRYHEPGCIGFKVDISRFLKRITISYSFRYQQTNYHGITCKRISKDRYEIKLADKCKVVSVNEDYVGICLYKEIAKMCKKEYNDTYII